MADILTLQEQGVVVLKNIFNFEQLSKLIQATEQCFESIEILSKEKGIHQVKNHLPTNYNFLPHVTSLNICALDDYDNSVITETLNLIESSPIREIISKIMGENSKLDLNQSWLRKQYAPANYHDLHHPHAWHQDGSLGLQFPLTSAQKYVDIPLNNLITCWLPLTDCGVDSPSLQFIAQRLEQPLHFNYLHEGILTEMFRMQDFYTPELAIGDAVIFLKGTLHKTYTNPAMTNNRISIEFRFFQSF
jgi:ectoine hydroxylase-related dioxygenase (phytanoyl-CoA dioxygenase family)